MSRGSSSTTSPTPRIRVPRLDALLVVDYFDYAARPVASARHAACHVTLLTVKFRQPSHEFTFGVVMTFVSYPLVLTLMV
jgi:hypothetical protein